MRIEDIQAAVDAVTVATGVVPNKLAAAQPTLDKIAEILRQAGDKAPKLTLTTDVFSGRRD